jgi:hypothetical protein
MRSDIHFDDKRKRMSGKLTEINRFFQVNQ